MRGGGRGWGGRKERVRRERRGWWGWGDRRWGEGRVFYQERESVRFFEAEHGIGDGVASRGLGDVYKSRDLGHTHKPDLKY